MRAPTEGPEFSILPVGERLVVRRIQQRQVGGVLMTEGSKDLGTEAEVMEPELITISFRVAISRSPGELEMLHPIRRGDRIFISRFVGVPIDIDGNEDSQLVIIKAEDVLGIKVVKEKADEKAQ